jgi:hypothetical protein
MGRPMTDFTPGYLDRMIELTKKRPRELFALLTHLEPPPMTNVGWGVLRFVKEEKDARGGGKPRRNAPFHTRSDGDAHRAGSASCKSKSRT